MNLTPEEIMAIFKWYNTAESEGVFTDKGIFLHTKGFVEWEIYEDELLKKLRSELDRQLDLVEPTER